MSQHIPQGNSVINAVLVGNGRNRTASSCKTDCTSRIGIGSGAFHKTTFGSDRSLQCSLGNGARLSATTRTKASLQSCNGASFKANPYYLIN